MTPYHVIASRKRSNLIKVSCNVAVIRVRRDYLFEILP